MGILSVFNEQKIQQGFRWVINDFKKKLILISGNYFECIITKTLFLYFKCITETNYFKYFETGLFNLNFQPFIGVYEIGYKKYILNL